jgi:hypothetical protein
MESRLNISRGREEVEAGNKARENALQNLFPKIPSPPLPLTLPLEEYAGTYNQPAYHEMVIEVKEGRLYVNRSNAAWKLEFEFEHVSGEFFLARSNSLTVPGNVNQVLFLNEITLTALCRYD